ncbi:MAG: HAD-IA family hydrolase [Candidatus Cloacimonadaceae bacterium]
MKPFLVFDFDGTLADSFGLGFEIINRLAPQLGLREFRDEDIEVARSMSIPKALQALKIPLFKVSRAIPLVISEFRHHVGEMQSFEGVREMLSELQKMGIQMALLSSNSEENLQHFIEQHHLYYFEWIEGTAGILNKQRSIRKMLKKHDLAPENVIYVGDEIRDIIASHKCGLKIIAVSWGYNTLELLASKDPDYLVDHPSQIVEIVKQLIQ